MDGNLYIDVPEKPQNAVRMRSWEWETHFSMILEEQNEDQAKRKTNTNTNSNERVISCRIYLKYPRTWSVASWSRQVKWMRIQFQAHPAGKVLILLLWTHAPASSCRHDPIPSDDWMDWNQLLGMGSEIQVVFHRSQHWKLPLRSMFLEGPITENDPLLVIIEYLHQSAEERRAISSQSP